MEQYIIDTYAEKQLYFAATDVKLMLILKN
jgi:hypothetical protein